MGCPKLCEDWRFVSAETADKNACPFLFSSEYLDYETNLVYYNYRYYSPELGRWTKRDSIREEGGFNLYGMVGNDPVGRWDYLGLSDPTTTSSSSSWEVIEATSEEICDCICAGGKVVLDFIGKIWAFPITATGIAIGVTGLAYDRIAGSGTAFVSFDNNAIEFQNYPWGQNPGAAVTLGNTVIYHNLTPQAVVPRYDNTGYVVVDSHEGGHTYQYQFLGIFYPVCYFAFGGFPEFNRNRDPRYQGNPLEQDADNYAQNPSFMNWISEFADSVGALFEPSEATCRRVRTTPWINQ